MPNRERGAESYRACVDRRIRQEGWALIEASPTRFYTLGLSASFGVPELFADDVTQDRVVALFTRIAGLAAIGHPLGAGRHRLDEQMFYLGRVLRPHVERLMPVIAEYFNTVRPVFQLVLPDPHGRFPWLARTAFGGKVLFDPPPGPDFQ